MTVRLQVRSEFAVTSRYADAASGAVGLMSFGSRKASGGNLDVVA